MILLERFKIPKLSRIHQIRQIGSDYSHNIQYWISAESALIIYTALQKLTNLYKAGIVKDPDMFHSKAPFFTNCRPAPTSQRKGVNNTNVDGLQKSKPIDAKQPFKSSYGNFILHWLIRISWNIRHLRDLASRGCTNWLCYFLDYLERIHCFNVIHKLAIGSYLVNCI